MSPAASREVLRRAPFGRLAFRRAFQRNASSTSEAASAAKDKASQATSKASEGLSRVTSSAGSALSSAGETLGKVGGRTGRLIGFISSLIPPTIYYSRVGLELGKMVFESRKMSPPSMATFQSYFQQVFNGIRNPSAIRSAASAASSSAQPNAILNQARNLSSAQVASGAVIAAELLGFFTVGEMIGRLKIVGYRGDSHGGHH